MTKVQPITNESVKSESEVLREQHLAQTPIDHILQKLSRGGWWWVSKLTKWYWNP